MDAQESTRIIEDAGGDADFARLLGIDSRPGYQQRVNNWKRRGIPASVALEHFEVIQHLRKLHAERCSAQSTSTQDAA